MRIGEVARAAGVNVQTLRYYERRGLLAQPLRTSTGYRQYGGDAVRLVRFVKRAQALGFSLDAIEELLAFRRGHRVECAQIRAAAQTKMADVEARIESLQAIRAALAELIASCRRRGSELSCPIIESLDDAPKRSPRSSR